MISRLRNTVHLVIPKPGLILSASRSKDFSVTQSTNSRENWYREASIQCRCRRSVGRQLVPGELPVPVFTFVLLVCSFWASPLPLNSRVSSCKRENWKESNQPFCWNQQELLTSLSFAFGTEMWKLETREQAEEQTVQSVHENDRRVVGIIFPLKALFRLFSKVPELFFLNFSRNSV